MASRKREGETGGDKPLPYNPFLSNQGFPPLAFHAPGQDDRPWGGRLGPGGQADMPRVGAITPVANGNIFGLLPHLR